MLIAPLHPAYITRVRIAYLLLLCNSLRLNNLKLILPYSEKKKQKLLLEVTKCDL
jgi:hypothetical protein